MDYQHYMNVIKNHGGKIVEARTNQFIIWDNKEGTVRRAYHFDYDGNFEGFQVLSRK